MKVIVTVEIRQDNIKDWEAPNIKEGFTIESSTPSAKNVAQVAGDLVHAAITRASKTVEQAPVPRAVEPDDVSEVPIYPPSSVPNKQGEEEVF